MHTADTLPDMGLSSKLQIKQIGTKFNYLPFTESDAGRDLSDFGTGEVYERQTSYLGEQNEVRDMVNHLEEYRWPGFWYEFIQGAFDYNDYAKGAVELNVWYEGVNQPVSFHDFLKAVNVYGLQHLKVRAVTIENFINKNSGLRPRNVALTQHEERLETGTLGVHGRGLKIATTAAYHGHLAEKVTFSSWTEEFGAWYGEARMAEDPVDRTSPPFLQMDYKVNKDLKAEKTVITIHRPSEAALESLIALPQWFLPFNEQYANNRLPKKDSSKIRPNHQTVYVNERLVSPDTMCSSAWAKSDMIEFGQTQLHYARFELTSEPPRTEILPSSLAPGSPPFDYVFVDGLRVKVVGLKFNFLYAFWGFGAGLLDGYNPKRSNDSLTLSQSVTSLVKELILKNEDEQVFFELLENVTSGLIFPGMEDMISGSRVNTLLRNSRGLVAFKRAWDRVLSIRFTDPIPERYYLAKSQREFEYAYSLHLPCVRVKSESWYNLIRHVYPELQTVEQLQEAERQKLVEEATALRKQNDELLRQQRLNFLNSRGITREATETGEIIKVTLLEKPDLLLESIKSDLRYVAAQYTIKCPTLESGPQSLTLSGSFTGDTVPVDVADFDQGLLRFIRNFLAIFGDQQTLELRLSVAGKGTYFLFKRLKSRDTRNAYSLSVERGEIQTDTKSEFSLVFQTYLQAGAEVIATEKKVDQYLAELVADFEAMSQEGVVSQELYQKIFARERSMSFAVLQARQELEEEKRRIAAEFEKLNEIRRAAGLPPRRNPLNKTEAVELDVSLRKGASAASNRSTGASQSPIDYDTLLKEDEPPEVIIDDTPSSELVLKLIHPTSRVGLSSVGKKPPDWEQAYIQGTPEQRSRLVTRMRRRMERGIETAAHPDFSLYSGDGRPLPGYLISHLNPEYSEVTLNEFEVLQQLPIKKMEGVPSLVFHKQLEAGLGSLYTPPGYRPVAVYGDGLEQADVVFSGHISTQQYAINLRKRTKAGLTVYFMPDPTVDTRTPGERSKKVLAEYDGLDQHWKQLVDTLKTSSLSEKRKLDLVLLAWVKAFTYDSSQDTFNEYQEVRDFPREFVTEIINKSAGDCGFAMRGLHGLLSLIGISVEEVGSFLANEAGQFSQKSSYHGLLRVHLDGLWVLIEPQRGYLQDGYFNELFVTDGYPDEQQATINRARQVISAIEPSKYRNPSLQIRMVLEAPRNQIEQATDERRKLDSLWERFTLEDNQPIDSPVGGGRRLNGVEVYHFGQHVDRLIESEHTGVPVHDLPRSTRLRYELLKLLEGYTAETKNDHSFTARAARELMGYMVTDRLINTDGESGSDNPDRSLDADVNVSSGSVPKLSRTGLTELTESVPLWLAAARRVGVPISAIVLAAYAANEASMLFGSVLGSGESGSQALSKLAHGLSSGTKEIISAHRHTFTELGLTQPSIIPLLLVAGLASTFYQELRVQKLKRQLKAKVTVSQESIPHESDAGVVAATEAAVTAGEFLESF